jgi:hypothetical protein
MRVPPWRRGALMLATALALSAAPAAAERIVITTNDTSGTVFDLANAQLPGRPAQDLALLFRPQDYREILLYNLTTGTILDPSAIDPGLTGQLHLILTPRPDRMFAILTPRFSILIELRDGIIESVPEVTRSAK